MFRKVLLSAVAAAAMTGVCATAQAQVLVEIEGPLSAYTATTANSGTLTVMNNKINVTAATAFVSPTETRANLFAEGQRNEAGAVYNVSNWMRGDTFDGRTQRGLLGATVIVTGTVDPVTGVITAEEVFSDVAENVILGAISANQCTNQACNAPGDYIRGNGPTGPAFVPNTDNRLPAGPITDAGLFELDLAGKSLVGTAAAPSTFGGEGYFSQTAVPVGAGSEQAVVYWAFELGENRPDLLLNPTIPEISSLRIRCTEGSRIEVRGFVHAPVNADGTPRGGNFAPGILNPTSGGQGRIRVVMNVDGVLTTFLDEDGAPPTADLPATYGVYRLRADIDQCGTEATVFWDRGNTTIAPWATVANVPVDRLREE
jgi:hypothetical protein